MKDKEILVESLLGKLRYLGPDEKGSWHLIGNRDEIDLWPKIESMFLSLVGERARQHIGAQGSYYMLFADSDSKTTFEYEPGKSALLTHERGFTNTSTPMEIILANLDGKMVMIQIDEIRKSIEIAFNPSTEKQSIVQKILRKIRALLSI